MKHIDRVRALLALADDPAASADEAAGARRMAERLMVKHGITARSLDPTGLAPVTPETFAETFWDF